MDTICISHSSHFPNLQPTPLWKLWGFQRGIRINCMKSFWVFHLRPPKLRMLRMCCLAFETQSGKTCMCVFVVLGGISHWNGWDISEHSLPIGRLAQPYLPPCQGHQEMHCLLRGCFDITNWALWKSWHKSALVLSWVCWRGDDGLGRSDGLVDTWAAALVSLYRGNVQCGQQVSCLQPHS